MGGTGGRIRAVAIVVAIGLLVVLPACTPLRQYPAAQTMFLGSAARATLLSEGTYATTLSREFNGLVPENELKWATIHPGPTTYNFAPADALVNFARLHSMSVRGVPLLWDWQNPAWLTEKSHTRVETRAILADHIATVVGHYKGRIAQWDVVNEPFDANGKLIRTIWKKIGRRYMDEAFAMARAADPAAKLFLNERGIEVPGVKADAVFKEVSKMKARGVPINGVGFQMHANTLLPTADQLAGQFARYSAIGVEVAITEMDVQLPEPATAEAIRAQADVYRSALATCRAAPNCKTFVVWGFTDKYSWIPLFFPGFGSATVMDSAYKNKPAYDALNKHLEAG
jgi:GH35 family endo-1,4-beta-xylanase